jgi:hypothetical protein
MNYIKLFEDGSTEATAELPTWGEVSATGDYHIDGLWYDKTGVLYTNQFTYLSNKGKLAGIEVANGIPVDIHYDELAPTLVEDTIKATDIIAGEYHGKNACTAWVNFDGTTTPPTIRDSFNVSDVVREYTGKYAVYFSESMGNNGYSVAGTSQNGISGGASAQFEIDSTSQGLFVDKVVVLTRTNTGNTPVSHTTVTAQIFGGK